MKRILLVCLKYPNVYSGYGKQLKTVTNQIVNISDDFQFTVVTGYDESYDSTPSIDVVHLLGRYTGRSKDSYTFARKLVPWAIKNKDKFDLIHCVKAGPEAMACKVISSILNKPLVVKVAQDELSDREFARAKGINNMTTRIRYSLLKKVNNFVAISDEIENNISKRTPKSTKIYRIPNGVDVSKYQSVVTSKSILREHLRFNHDELVLLHVGSVNSRKGVYDILEALRNIKLTSKLRFVICGPILENNSFYEKVDELNKNEMLNVDYRGEVDNIPEYMKAADLFVLASYSEGLPNVVLEAGASGLPSIVTRIGGSVDIIESGKNGIIVNVGDVTQLRKAIETFDNTPDLLKKMGRNAFNTVSKNYSIKFVAESYIKLYKDLEEIK